jgi:hypothetical protein
MKEKTTFIQAVFPSHHGGATLFLAYRSDALSGSDRKERAAGKVKQPENTLTTRVRATVSRLIGKLTRLRTPRIRARAPQAG